jgi:acetyl-CoA carboxylase biotin carboxyl carrier protein
VAVAAAAPVAAPEVAAVPAGKEITSPMVGTFYSAPSPDSPSFVSVGQAVTPDTVICIIEAMKVMNEIKAEVSGVVTEVLAENGKPVQFGQALFRVT